MRKKLTTLMVVSIITALLSACGVGTDKASNGATNSYNGLQKYNSYVDLSNYLNNWMLLNLSGYFNTFGYEYEFQFVKKRFDPAAFDGRVVSPIVEQFFDQVDEAVQYADQSPVFEGADEQMKELGPKIKELMTTINEIESYYSSKGFIEDEYNKGKELHRTLYDQYTSFWDAFLLFNEDFKVIIAEEEQKNLASLKDEGYMITYYAKSVVMNAKAIQEAFYTNKVFDDNLMEFDAIAYKALYTPLAENIDGFLKAIADSSQAEQEGYSNYWRFDTYITDVKAAATSILQALEGEIANKSYLQQYDQALSSLISSYNNMIQYSTAGQ